MSAMNASERSSPSGADTSGTSSGSSSGLKDEARHLGEAARAAAHDARERARAGFDEVRDELRAEGSRLTSAASDEAYRFAEGRKQAAADALHDLARSIRDSSNAFEDRPNLAAFFDSAAEGLDGFADTVGHRTFAQLYSDAEETARRHPAAFALGAGAVGMLLARFARSSGLRARLEEERYEAQRRWEAQQSAGDNGPKGPRRDV